jgi:hypothetical protein
VLQRVQNVIGARAGGAGASALVIPANPTATTAVDLGGGAQLERFECGYYDAGLLNRDASAPVQMGCYYHVVSFVTSGGNPTQAGYSGAVPAALQPSADNRWPEEALLRGVKASGMAPASAASSGQ